MGYFLISACRDEVGTRPIFDFIMVSSSCATESADAGAAFSLADFNIDCHADLL
jgi:hypothetical protein